MKKQKKEPHGFTEKAFQQARKRKTSPKKIEIPQETLQELSQKIYQQVRSQCAGAICNHCSDVLTARATKSAGGRWIHELSSGKALPCEAWKIWEFV